MFQLANEVIGLKTRGDLTNLINYLKTKEVVMLGEASHGTKEFYAWRREISEILLKDHGFQFIAVEGDYPDCAKINEFIKVGELDSLQSGVTALSVLREFKRWPTWMWANKEIIELMNAMQKININRSDEEKVGFYGLDVYSLFESIEAVKYRCKQIDPNLESFAIQKYKCFEAFHRKEERYIDHLLKFPEETKVMVVQVLKKLLAEKLEGIDTTKDKRLFDAQQNAFVVVDADRYYQASFFGKNSWNVRDEHMMDTLERLRQYPSPGSKCIVWAHNTHIGDYHFTQMLSRGEVNIGGLAREKYGDEKVALVGFSTYKGTVLAAHKWGDRVKKLNVPNAKTDSVDALLHSVSADATEAAYYFIMSDLSKDAKKMISERKGQRAIGVIYKPEQEKYGNYVPTVLTRRYDAMIFINKTNALTPINYDSGEVEEIEEEMLEEGRPDNVATL
jgi:erythromycin esterase-like protein